MQDEPKNAQEGWWRKHWFDAIKFAVTSVIAVAAVWIGILQNQINGQLRDLEYFKLLQPNIGESLSSSTWTLTLTNYGESPIYIDSEAITNAKFPIPIKKTVFPNQSIEQDLHPFVAAYNLIPPQGSTTLSEYEIFFSNANTNGPIYVGQLPMVFDYFLTDHFQVMTPIQNVYVQQLREPTFQNIYDEMGK